MNREQISVWLMDLQDSICNALEEADGKSKFIEDNWKRKEGGGGRTRIIKDGTVIEKGGVLYSAVEGNAPDFLFKEPQHGMGEINNRGVTPKFYATGVSIVIHPQSPLVPIIHMNVRFFEMYRDGQETLKWFGGGIDLTPHYINEENARYFHSQLKQLCDKHHSDYYTKFKKWADDYFYLPHRDETRGVGGIFFDRLNASEDMRFEQNLNFWKDVGRAFAPIYTELIRQNKNKSFTENNKQWQLLRRGRYVEFNLLYDKGTKFGLESNGRVESIFMSLPKLAGWEYDFKPEEGSQEEKTLNLLKKGVNWV